MNILPNDRFARNNYHKNDVLTGHDEVLTLNTHYRQYFAICNMQIHTEMAIATHVAI